MSTLSGNATTEAGAAADFVRIFRWPDNKLETTVVPDAAGDWTAEVTLTGDYGLTYIAAGCQPITHGPYYIEVPGDPHWDNVVALLHFNEDLMDEMGGGWDSDPSLTTFETNDPLFGTASLRSLGKGLGAFRSNPISDPAAEFTIEGFVKVISLLPPAVNGNVGSALYGQPQNTSSGDFGLWFRHSPEPAVVLDLRGGTSGAELYNVSEEFVIELGQWYHFAHTYDGINHRVFVDGVMVIESAQTFGWKNTNQPFRVGSIYLPSYPAYRHGADALFDEFRITKGVARYTEDFTPPTGPFPNHGPA